MGYMPPFDVDKISVRDDNGMERNICESSELTEFKSSKWILDMQREDEKEMRYPTFQREVRVEYHHVEITVEALNLSAAGDYANGKYECAAEKLAVICNSTYNDYILNVVYANYVLSMLKNGEYDIYEICRYLERMIEKGNASGAFLGASILADIYNPLKVGKRFGGTKIKDAEKAIIYYRKVCNQSRIAVYNLGLLYGNVIGNDVLGAFFCWLALLYGDNYAKQHFQLFASRLPQEFVEAIEKTTSVEDEKYVTTYVEKK